MSLISVDIETACAVKDCPKGAKCWTDYKHGLIHHKNRITCVGVHDGTSGRVFRGTERDLVCDLMLYLSSLDEPQLEFQNGAFDIKGLAFKGADAEWLINHWVHDTQLMAYVSTNKVSKEFLEEYNIERERLNKLLPQGYSHRQAGQHSLKTMAPYFLGVPSFWEDPTDHDNDEYVLKDCEYTWLLQAYFIEHMATDQYDFYKNKQLPWAKELLRAELKGVRLDLGALDTKESEAHLKRDQAHAEVCKNWREPFKDHRLVQYAKWNEYYLQKKSVAWNKLKKTSPEHVAKVNLRYETLLNNKMEKLQVDGKLQLNLDSPLQLAWLLKDYLGLDIRNFDGKESTDKEVLERLSASNPDVQALLDYRKWEKLCSTYYPSYRKFVTDKGRIHCSFNTSITRTGRLSSSMPNLQNQPPETRSLFIADEGHVLITRDLSSIEPCLVAYYSEDPELCSLIIEGKKFHARTAAEIFSYVTCDNLEVKKLFPAEYDVAKTGGLAILYGSGANRLRNILFKAGFTTYSKQYCKQAVKRIRNLYAGVSEFKSALDARLEQGEIAYNLFGRPIYFDNPDDVYMKGFNRLIQGSASDLVCHAIHANNTYCREVRADSQVLITVHDEIVTQAPVVAAEFYERILDACMTDLVLKTKYGVIPLTTEGAISGVWEK